MKKSISILVAILMLMSALTATTQFDSAGVNADTHTNALFAAVRWAPNGRIWSGDQIHPPAGQELLEARNFTSGGHMVSWGRPGFDMPSPVHCWTEFYLDVDADSGASQESNHWFVVVDTNGNLWFDKDGHFHDSRYYLYADPWHPAYQLDPARTDDNCKENPFARVDPITSNNTQGPYHFPVYNISEQVDAYNSLDENPIYFMDKSSFRTFRIGYADLEGHNPGSVVEVDPFTGQRSWDAGLELERFLDGRNPQNPIPFPPQEPPWDYDGTGPATNHYDVNEYFFSGFGIDIWNFGEEWHTDNTPGTRDTAGPDNMHEYLFGDFIYRKGAIDAGNMVTGMDINMDIDFPHFWGSTRLVPVVMATASGRFVRYPAGSVVIDDRSTAGAAPGFRDPGDDLDVGTPVFRFPLSAGNFSPMGHPVINLQGPVWANVDSVAHLEAPWGYEEPEWNRADPELFDYAVQQTPNGNVSLAEAIYSKATGGSLIEIGDTRLTNWGSGMMFLDRTDVTGFIQPGDLFILSEVIKGGCATPTYDISVQTDLWEGMQPSVTTASLRSPNGEVTHRSQTIQKSTVLGPVPDEFAVPACTFEGIKLDYREYLGIEIWKDDGVNNMLDMGHLGNTVYNVIEYNNSDDYNEGETSELFVGAQGSEVDADIGLGHDTLTQSRQLVATTQAVLPMSDFFQQTRRLDFTLPNGPAGAGTYGALGHPYTNILSPNAEQYFEVNPHGFGAPVRFFDTAGPGGYVDDALGQNLYGCGEALYRDMDYLLAATEGVGAFEISMGDIRLTEVTITRMDPATNTSTVIVYHRDSVVAPGDQDVNLYPGLGPNDRYNNIVGGNDLSPFITNYYDGLVMAHEVYPWTSGGIISGLFQPVWLDWEFADPYDTTKTVPMNHRYNAGEFIYDAGHLFVTNQWDKDASDPGLEFQGEDNSSSWSNPFGTISEGWTRLTEVEYMGQFYNCGTQTSITDEWINTIPVTGITYGRNGNRHFMDMEVIPGDPGVTLKMSSDLKVEQTTEFTVSMQEGAELVAGHWDGPSWIPDEVGYVLLQGNGIFVGPSGNFYLNNILYELTPNRPEASFHFTPYRGNCLNDPPGDPGDLVDMFIMREKGGVHPAPPDGVYGDYFFERWYKNANYDLGQTPFNYIPFGMIGLEIPDETRIPYPPIPDFMKNSYDCFKRFSFPVAPEELIIESSKLCITTLDQRFPNLEFTLFDADNENDVNDPANIPFSIPFDNNGDNLFNYNVVNYNCHGGGIDFMACAAPADPTSIDDPSNHKFIIQYNLDGTYFYWYWYEPTNTATLNNPQIPGALDPNDVVIGQEWTMGFPIDPSEDVKRTPVIVDDRTYLDDVDCSQGEGLCDACPIDGMRPLGDVTGVYYNELRSDKLGMFDGTFGHIYQYGIPTYVTGYGQLTDADQGGSCLAMAKPTDGSTHMLVRIYSYKTVFDYNSTIAHPGMTDGAPYFVYDKMTIGEVPRDGIDYCGIHDMKVYPPDPYVNFAEFHVIDHALQFSKVHYTAGANTGGYIGPLSPLNIPTPQIMAPYDPILRFIPTEFRAYPGGQTHAGRSTGQVWGNYGGPFGWNAYPAIWSRQSRKGLQIEQFGKLGTEFFPLTDYMLIFVLKDGSGRHLSFDPNHNQDRRITRMIVSGPFARPKILNHTTGSVVSPYNYNGMTQVPIQYDWSGKIVIDETNWKDFEMVEVNRNFNGDAVNEPYAAYGNIPNENDQYRNANPFIDKLDNLNFASLGYMNPIGASQHENTDNVFVIDELIPWQPGKILVYVTLYDGTFKMYQDCCTSPPTDGIDVHALGIEYTISEDDEIQHIPLGIDNKLEIKLTEEEPFTNDIAGASKFCNDAFVYVWQDRGVSHIGQDFYYGAGDAWVTNPPGSSRFYHGRTDGNAAQYDVTWNDEPIDINGNGIVSFAERETEIVGSYNIATNTWEGGLVDARTFQRNNGVYVFELTEDAGCQVTDSGLDFGGEEGIGDEPDHIISDKELLPLYVTAYKYGDDNNDRSFSPFWDPSPLQETYQTADAPANQMRFSHEVYLAGQIAIAVEPEDNLIVNLASPNKLTAGITPELISPDTPLMIEVKDEFGDPVDLSYGIADIDGEFIVEDEDIWKYLFRDPHPDNKFYYGQEATLPQYYYLRTDLHNDDETLANNEELYSVRTIDMNGCIESMAIPFRPIETNFSNKSNGQYIFRGFCANDVTTWKGEPGDPDEEEWLKQHQFVVYVYTPDRKNRGTLIIDIDSPHVDYEIINVEDETETAFISPGDPDFVMTAADNRVYKVKVTVFDAEGRLVKGVTRGVSVCGGGVKSTARFTPFTTRPDSFELDFNPCEGAPCGSKLYPHIGFDFNASGKNDGIANAIQPGNREFYRMGGFFLTSDLSYQICRDRTASGYVEYNTTNYWYEFNNSWETDYVNPTDPTHKGWAINMLIPPNLQFMPSGISEPIVRGWGLGAIYNYEWFQGALFTDVDRNGNLDYHDALGLDVNAQTEFYIWAEDVFDLGGLVGDNVYVNNLNEADLVGYPPRDRTDPREMHRRFRYTVSNDQTFYLDWEAWPDHVAAVRAPRVTIHEANDMDRPEYGKDFLNTNYYDLVYNVPNHMVCMVYPADDRDLRMHEDGIVMFVGNQHETTVFGKTKNSDYDAKATETIDHFTPTGTGEATLKMYYMSKNKWFVLNTEVCCEGDIKMEHPEYYSVFVQDLDVGKGLALDIKTFEPLTPKAAVTLFITVTEVGTDHPVSGAKVKITGQGLDLTKSTDGNGKVEIEVSPASTGFITITATNSDYKKGSARMMVGADSTPPILVVNPPPPITNKAEISITGSTDSGVTITINGKKATTKADGTFKGTVTLKAGKNPITVVALDGSGNITTKTVYTTLDTELPSVLLETKGPFYNTAEITLKGRVEPGCIVVIKDKSGSKIADAIVVHDNFEAKNIKLKPAPSKNEFVIEATDQAGNIMTTQPFVIENIERITAKLSAGNKAVVVNDVSKALIEAYDGTFVPADFFRFLGATVETNIASGSVEIKINGSTLVLNVGSSDATLDGKTISIYSDPKNGKTGTIMVPAKIIAEALGCTAWEDGTALFVRYDRH
jgi:Copper amine oxidase N-terminal domain/Glucodextranase, domain B